MSKETRITLSVIITGLLSAFGIWYILSYSNGTNPIQLKISEIGNGKFFPDLLSNCLSFGMIGVAICCANTLLVLPELITEGNGVTSSLIFCILRAVLAIVLCVLISIELASTGKTVIGKILYVLLSIVLTVIAFAPTIAFLIQLVNEESLAGAIIGFLYLSGAVILLLALFIPAIIILVIIIALKLLSFFTSSSSDYSYGSSDDDYEEEVEETTYIDRNGITTELIQVDATTWRDTYGNYYTSEDGGKTFYED